MTEEQIAALAAKVAAKSATEHISAERMKQKQGYADRVRSLLENYATLKSFVDSSVYESTYTAERVSFDDLMEDLMTPGKDVSVVVEAIQRSAQRTKAVYRHITVMLTAYRRRCNETKQATVRRRWRIIDGLYINPKAVSVGRLAELEHVSERVIYQDIQTACEELAPYFFGVDALN